MSDVVARRTSRAIAIMIAIAGLIDPAVTISGATRPRLALVVSDLSQEADAVRAQLAGDLQSAFEVVPAVTSDSAAAIVIGDRYPDASFADALRIATVTLPAPPASARIARVDAPPEAPAGTAIKVGVDVEGDGLGGRTTDVVVEVGGLEVGRAPHAWREARERWHATIDAIPVGGAPWRIRVSALTRDAATDVADVVVDARRQPFHVQMYEPRPSWTATFVRRAIAADARYEVASISESSRTIATRTQGAVALEDPRVDRADVVIVGGLDRLSATDARALDRFMRRRGGAVILLPDVRPAAGPARDLLRSEPSERLLEQPAALATTQTASLQASELLTWPALDTGADVLASLAGKDGAAVVVSSPRGDGRLLVSGAMDAWRFRARDNGAFDRFWQSTVAGLALAAAAPLELDVQPRPLRPGQHAEVIVRVRAYGGEPVRARAGGQPVRLVPAAEAGVFHGSFVAGSVAGLSNVTADVGGRETRSISQSVVVRDDARPLTAAAPLSLLSASHGGIDATPDRVGELESFARRTVTAPKTGAVRHPMRSAWWILPFAACLSAEWWSRRRRGLR